MEESTAVEESGLALPLERERASQVAASGDPSVLDLFLPKRGAGDGRMRAHRSGPLTLTLCSRAAASRWSIVRMAWVDVEALCTPDEECIVLQ